MFTYVAGNEMWKLLLIIIFIKILLKNSSLIEWKRKSFLFNETYFNLYIFFPFIYIYIIFIYSFVTIYLKKFFFFLLIINCNKLLNIK